jgi:shikimate kinase
LLPAAKPNIALTGFMAVGKSAVGRSLARRLNLRFVDLDKAIEKAAGMKVQEIFRRKGEPYFRSLEKQILAQTLQQNGQVIATGGGAVTDEENLRLLREKTILVCLTASADAIHRRVGTVSRRPLLRGGDVKIRITELLHQRAPSYARAHASIDTTDLTVDQAAEKIIALLKSRELSR